MFFLKFILRSSTFLSIVLMTSSCGSSGGTDVGNPSFPPTSRFAVVGIQKASSSTALSFDSGVEITEARIVVSHFKFRLKENCDQETETDFHFKGPFIADLLTNQTIPEVV